MTRIMRAVAAVTVLFLISLTIEYTLVTYMDVDAHIYKYLSVIGLVLGIGGLIYVLTGKPEKQDKTEGNSDEK